MSILMLLIPSGNEDSITHMHAVLNWVWYLHQKVKTVMYIRWQLKIHERNYPSYDSELMTIVFALVIMIHYLSGK